MCSCSEAWLFLVALMANAAAIDYTSSVHQSKLYALSDGQLRRHNIFWDRISKLRRMIDIDSYEWSRERGPPRLEEKYNPTYGFEPFWEFGDWVFDKVRLKPGEVRLCSGKCPPNHINNLTAMLRRSREQTLQTKMDVTPRAVTNTNIPCTDSIIHFRLGPVCAVNQHFQQKTYRTVCELRSYNCDHHTDWKMFYRGACLGTSSAVLTDPAALVSRADHYLDERSERIRTTTVNSRSST